MEELLQQRINLLQVGDVVWDHHLIAMRIDDITEEYVICKIPGLFLDSHIHKSLIKIDKYGSLYYKNKKTT